MIIPTSSPSARQKTTWELDAPTKDGESAASQAIRGYAPMRRLRAGEYRIVFRLEVEVVKIVLIGKRNDDEVYKMLERIREK